ncbi:MAG: hypothetical protein U1F37_19430 [Alphaproteobacteria bacterium]
MRGWLTCAAALTYLLFATVGVALAQGASDSFRLECKYSDNSAVIFDITLSTSRVFVVSNNVPAKFVKISADRISFEYEYEIEPSRKGRRFYFQRWSVDRYSGLASIMKGIRYHAELPESPSASSYTPKCARVEKKQAF